MGYVDYEVPDEIMSEVLKMLSEVKDSGRIKKGVNEATKSIERKTAKLVVIAKDVDPEEIVVHIPPLCKDMGIPYTFVNSKKELGNAVGLPVAASVVAVESPGNATEMLQDILKKLPKVWEKKEDKAKAEAK